LTKAEVLQIVNLAPSSQVELYAVRSLSTLLVHLLLTYYPYYTCHYLQYNCILLDESSYRPLTCQIIEMVDERFQPDPSGTLDLILGEVRASLLETVPEHLEHVGQPPPPEPEAWELAMDEEEMGMNMAVDEDVGAGGEEFVVEAEWGAAHEGGVEDERDGEIDS
jgi:hypothetical protein